MITRKVRLQIAAFIVIALVGVSFAGARYAGLDRLFGPRGYVVNVQLADSGGIFRNAEVTYRGVPVGKVGELKLTPHGVVVPLDIGSEHDHIPRNVQAVVANRSAVGEQYVDLRPRTNSGPYLQDGSVIPQRDTSTPVPVQNLMTHLDGLAKSVPPDSLRTVVDELGAGFRGNGPALQNLLDTTSDFTNEAQKHVPQTLDLLHQSKQVLATQNDKGSDIKSFSHNLKNLSAQMKKSDPDVRRIIHDAPPAADQISGVLQETGPQLGQLTANLVSTADVLKTRTDGIEQLMVTYPLVAGGAFTVAPGDGTAHFGLALNVFDPPVCTKGYGGTNKRPGDETSDVPVNGDAHCEAPPGSGIDVRGARNAPRAGHQDVPVTQSGGGGTRLPGAAGYSGYRQSPKSMGGLLGLPG